VSNEKNEKKAIWVYAVVLFTSAFIVLLLTAYSQLKFNRNIDEYRNQLSSSEKEKVNYQTNLNTLRSENSKLSDELKKLKEEFSKANNELEENKKDIENLHNKTISIQMYETLTKADMEYENGNITGCAELLLKNINIDFLDSNGKQKYAGLVNKSFKKAAYELYSDGYKCYQQEEYQTAIQKFELSYELAKYEYFSDDCIYFMAYSEYRQGNIDNAKKYIQELVKDYPESNYKNDALNLLKQITG